MGKLLQMSATQTTGGAQQVVQYFFRIRETLEFSEIGQADSGSAVRIPSRTLYRIAIKKQPRFGHTNWNNTYKWRKTGRTASPCLLDRRADLINPFFGELSFGVPMNKQKVAGIQIQGMLDPFLKSPWRVGNTSDVRPHALDETSFEVLP